MKVLYVLALMLMFISCESDDEQFSLNQDEIIVGLSFGQCGGDCSYVFLIQDNKVFPDEGVDRIPIDPSELSFSSIPLDGFDTSRIDSLLDEYPVNLSDFEQADFGCPDCGDWGALHVFRSSEVGIFESYTLDNATSNMNPALQPYGELLQRSIDDFRR